MRKASSLFFPQLRRSHKIPLCSLSDHRSFSQLHSRQDIPSPAANGRDNHSRHFPKTDGNLSFNFIKNEFFSRNFNSQAENASEEYKDQLWKDFLSLKSTTHMETLFKEMEAIYDEAELAVPCLVMGIEVYQEGKDPEKALSLANRALKISVTCDTEPSLELAMSLGLLGSVCFSLNRLDDSLEYLEGANRVFNSLEIDGSRTFRLPRYNDPYADDERTFWLHLHAVQYGLFGTKTAIGRREEAIDHIGNALEIREKLSMDEDSGSLGFAYRDVAEAYLAVLNFKGALPYCLKALYLFKEQYGQKSLYSGLVLRLLGVIYTGLGEHEKALEQNKLSREVFRSWGANYDLLLAESEGANMLIALGRFDKAMDTLKGVVNQPLNYIEHPEVTAWRYSLYQVPSPYHAKIISKAQQKLEMEEKVKEAQQLLEELLKKKGDTGCSASSKEALL
ncbi:OLC1v1007065C1 [Oldenlandia corymbosa var. corymbosa]|uniref:OLC1v1007065C1 n=1 Tax=Oldenlandia corymbosa var. corymbosa TaxID=529605 RepID=A0AAV1DLH3_OLDCO|nr:OLC1v1007065C1 [Oldenlandia corymbosa var. corymbosa]